MDTIENGTSLLKKISRHWSIPLISLFDHLYGKTRSRKLGPIRVLTLEENQVVIVWVLFYVGNWVIN